MGDILDVAWAKVSPELRERMVDHLRKLPNLQEVYEHRNDGSFHFTTGMNLRNYLRETITDRELPSFDEYYGEGTNVRNWDDYYMHALEVAVNADDTV